MKTQLTIFAVLLFSLTACHKKEKDSVQSRDVAIGEAQSTKASPPTAGVADYNVAEDAEAPAPEQPTPPDLPLNAGSPADWDKKIIKNADVTIEVKDFKAYDQLIHGAAKKFGAYFASEQQNKDDVKIENVITIKVPVEQFEPLLNSLAGSDDKILSKRVYAEDVTDQLIDTKARLEAKRQVRDRYMELLKQAKSMKDIIEVQREINTIQEELEAAEGRVKYLSHQSAYSTINLTYFEYVNGGAGSENSFITKLKNALKDGGSMIGSFLLLIASFWPLIVGALLTWYLIKRPSISLTKR